MLATSCRVAALLASVGLLPAAAQAAWTASAFQATSLPEVLKALGAGAPAESREVSLTAPDVAENGASVQVSISSSLPRVRRMLLLVEKNPNLLSAIFEVSDAVEPAFGTRIKMSESSFVYAVALTDDGRTFFARKDVRVTIGGCAT